MPTRLCFKLVGGDRALVSLLCREIEEDARIEVCALTNLTSHVTSAVDANDSVTVNLVPPAATNEPESYYMMLLTRGDAERHGDAVCAYIVPAIHRLRSALTCHRLE